MLLRNRKEDLLFNTIKLLIQERKEVFFISIIELKLYLSPIKNEISEIDISDIKLDFIKQITLNDMYKYLLSTNCYYVIGFD